MAELVYILCATTCLLCTVLLARGYRRSRRNLLLWATACFAGLFLNNVVTTIDLVVVPELDLHWIRSALGLGSVALLAIGLLWEEP